MSIGSFSSISGSLLGSTSTSLSGLLTGTGSGNNSGSGAAYTLGGSTTDFTSGIYSNLGNLLGVTQPNIQVGGAAAEKRAEERQATINQSAALIDAGNTAAGRRIAEEMLDERGDDITAIRLVGLSYLAEQDYVQAERFFSRAAGLRPGDSELRADAEAARILQRSDDEVLAEGRKRLDNAGQRVNGIRLLLRLTDRSPDNGEAYLALADGFQDARQPVQVIGALQEALSLSSGSDLEGVIARAESLVDDEPTLGIAHNILGRALLKAGDVEKAISRLRTATTVAPENLAYRGDLAEAFFARSELFLERGDVLSALGSLEAGRAIDPGNTAARPLEGRIAAKRGEKLLNAGLYSRALSELNKAKLRGPDDVAFKRELSVSFARLARRFELDDSRALALSTYRKAYELNEDSGFARRKVAELSYAEGVDALDNGNFDSAVEHLGRAYDLQRGNDTYRTQLSAALVQRGSSLLEDGEIESAIEDFERAFELDPSNSEADQQLSAALAELAAA